MKEDEALLLLEELEKVETENGLGVEKDVEEWWRRYFPQVPDEVLQRMKGQGKHWSECSGPPLPWNRRRRRQIEASKGVILHLFSGGAVTSKKWEELRKNGYEVITLDIHQCRGEPSQRHDLVLFVGPGVPQQVACHFGWTSLQKFFSSSSSKTRTSTTTC